MFSSFSQIFFNISILCFFVNGWKRSTVETVHFDIVFYCLFLKGSGYFYFSGLDELSIEALDLVKSSVCERQEF